MNMKEHDPRTHRPVQRLAIERRDFLKSVASGATAPSPRSSEGRAC